MTTGLTVGITEELVAELEQYSGVPSIDALLAERAELKRALADADAAHMLYGGQVAELERDAAQLKEIISAVVREHPRRSNVRGNAPGHDHDIPGAWDSDNGELAGTECAWCKTWAIATAAAGLGDKSK